MAEVSPTKLRGLSLNDCRVRERESQCILYSLKSESEKRRRNWIVVLSLR